MVKLGSLFPNFKSWSNFRLMLVLGTTVTILSLAVGAVVVQAALSDGDSDTPTAEETESSEAREDAEINQEVGSSEEGPPEAPSADGSRPAARGGELGADFRISCLAGEPTSTRNTCEVESFGGFSARVELSCAELPANLSCSFTPDSVVPRRNGSSTFRLQLQASDVVPGSYVFDVVGRSGNRVRTYRYPWGVQTPNVAVDQGAANLPAAPGQPAAGPPAASAPPVPTFAFTCGSLNEGVKVPWSLSKDGSLVKINCFLTPLNGFNEPVQFKFAQPDELAKPDTVRFIVDQLQVRKVFDLNFELGDAVTSLPAEQLKQGVDYPFEVTGTSASGKALTRQVILTITE